MAASHSSPASSSLNLISANDPTAYTPAAFCRAVAALWQDTSGGFFVAADKQSRIRRKKRRSDSSGPYGSDDGSSDSDTSSSSSAASSTSSSSTGHAHSTQKRKRIVKQSKSAYLRVDLSDSQSCSRNIRKLQIDKSLRSELAKLVELAQAHPPTSCEDSGNQSPDKSAVPQSSPTKRKFRNARQLLHAEDRDETVERRVYLRYLMSQTIIRLIEKNTGCKYVYRADRVNHYRATHASQNPSENGTASRNPHKKASCIFYYDCASSEYEPCAGTLRIVMDLDLGMKLADSPNQTNLDNKTGSQGSDTNALSDDDENEPLRKAAAKVATTPSRTPITRTYGSKKRHWTRTSVFSAPSSRASSLTPSLNSHLARPPINQSMCAIVPFTVAVRMTHIPSHTASYAVLRARHKYRSEKLKAKLKDLKSQIDKKMAEVQQLNSGADDLMDETYERKLKEMLKLVKEARKLSRSTHGRHQKFHGRNRSQEAESADNTEEKTESATESSGYTESEEERILESDGDMQADAGEAEAQKAEVVGENERTEPVVSSKQGAHHKSSREAARKDIMIPRMNGNQASLVNGHDHSDHPPNMHPKETLPSRRRLRPTPADKASTNITSSTNNSRSTSPNGETDYSEPEYPSSAPSTMKRKRTSGKKHKSNDEKDTTYPAKRKKK